jgi:hypothetical protein
VTGGGSGVSAGALTFRRLRAMAASCADWDAAVVGGGVGGAGCGGGLGGAGAGLGAGSMGGSGAAANGQLRKIAELLPNLSGGAETVASPREGGGASVIST